MTLRDFVYYMYNYGFDILEEDLFKREKLTLRIEENGDIHCFLKPRQEKELVCSIDEIYKIRFFEDYIIICAEDSKGLHKHIGIRFT